MSFQATTWVLEHSEARLGDRLVLISISNHCDRRGEEAWPSIETIALEARMSPRNVKRSLRRLEELGELEIEWGAGPNRTHRYRLPGVAKGGPLHAVEGDKLSPREGDRLSPHEGDKSDQKGVTNRAKSRSDLSPKQSEEQSEEQSVCRARAREADRDPEQDHAEFEALKAAYPQFAGRQDWLSAQHHCYLLLDRGLASWGELRAAVERYGRYVAAGGVSSPKYVLTPAKFFGAADEPWKQTWEIPDEAGKQDSERGPGRYEASSERLRRWAAGDDGVLGERD